MTVFDRACASMALDTSPEPAPVTLEVWKETDALGVMVGAPYMGIPYVQHFGTRYVVAVLKEGFGTLTYSYCFDRDLRYPAIRHRTPADRFVRHEKSLPLHDRLAAERAVEHAKTLMAHLEHDMVTRMLSGAMKPDDLYAWCKRIRHLDDTKHPIPQ